jgi:hypothetical protein
MKAATLLPLKTVSWGEGLVKCLILIRQAVS